MGRYGHSIDEIYRRIFVASWLSEKRGTDVLTELDRLDNRGSGGV